MKRFYFVGCISRFWKWLLMDVTGIQMGYILAKMYERHIFLGSIQESSPMESHWVETTSTLKTPGKKVTWHLQVWFSTTQKDNSSNIGFWQALRWKKWARFNKFQWLVVFLKIYHFGWVMMICYGWLVCFCGNLLINTDDFLESCSSRVPNRKLTFCMIRMSYFWDFSV